MQSKLDSWKFKSLQVSNEYMSEYAGHGKNYIFVEGAANY